MAGFYDETPSNQIVQGQSLGQPDPLLRQYTPELGATAVRRGVNQALGLGADYFGSLAEAAGQDPQALNAYADQQMLEAQMQQAGPQTLGDINGIGSAFDYATNKAGESFPVSATALGVGLATRGRSLPARIGLAAAPVFPVTAGETSYAMRQDPQSAATAMERAVTSTGAGAVNSALEVLPELGAASVLGHAARRPAATMAGALGRGAKQFAESTIGEGLTEGLQDTVSRAAQAQFNPNIGVNPITDPAARASFLENAAAGAAGGAVFGGPAAVGATLEAAPTPQVPQVNLEGLRQGVGNLVTPGSTSERIAPEDIPANQTGNFINDVLRPQAERAQRFVQDVPGNIEQTIRNQMEREDSLTNQAKAVRDRLLKRSDLTPDEQDILSLNPDMDPDVQDAVHEIDQQKGIADTIRRSLQRFAGVEEGRASRVNPQVPLEAVDSIVKSAGVEQEAQDPLVRQWLAAYGEKFKSGSVDSRDIADALDIFGERGYSVLRALAGETGSNRAAIDRDQQASGQLDQFLFQALKPEFRDTIKPGQLRQLGNLVRGAADRGEGDLPTVLETAFQNPQEVMAALDSGVGRLDIGRSQRAEGLNDEDGNEVEFGDTQSVSDVTNRYFGDLSGGKRIRAGDETLGYPVTKEQAMEIGQKTEGMTRNSDISLVPARTVYQELGVDAAQVEERLGRSLDGLFYLRGQEPRTESSPSAPFTRTLRTNTVADLNTAGRDPSAGSYIAAETESGEQAAIDVRKMVNSQVFGNRTPEALLEALNNGLADAISRGYNIRRVPDDLVLAKYGQGADEQVMTVGRALAESAKRGTRSAETSADDFPLNPQDFEALQAAGYQPQVDFRTGELHLNRDDASEIIDRYAAAVANANSKAKGIPVPKWAQLLMEKHGTDFPTALGRASQTNSIVSRLRAWGNKVGLDTKALAAISASNMRDRADAAAARVRAEEERQGPETGVMESDAETVPAQVIEAETGREGAAAREPERPYAVRKQPVRESVRPYRKLEQPQHADFFTTADKAAQVHREQFWATGDLPTGVDLQGVYGTLGKIAGKGQPLQVVVAKGRGQEFTDDMKKLVEAYQRRGFNVRTETKMLAPMQDSPYSETVAARVLGPTGDSPAHVVLSVGDTRAAALARRIGIPVIDLTNKVQQKIAGDILRSYDRGRRADLARTEMPAPAKAKMREGEERQGTDRSRDMLNAGLEAAITGNVSRPDIVDDLLRVSSLAARADNDFFDAAMAAKEPLALARSVDRLEAAFAAYQKEQGKASMRPTNSTPTASQQEFKNAKDYVAKVLPDDVRVLVRQMATVSGLYTETTKKDGSIDKLISLSAYAQDPMSVAHHESMHALISSLANQEEQAPFIRAMLKAANSPLVISRLRALLKDEQQALDQITADPEERIAYMYEFWAAGQLQLTSSVENWLVKLVQTLRGIFGVLDNNQKAELYMAAFRDGKLKDPSAVNTVVMDSLSVPERAIRALPFARKVEKITRKVIETAHGRLKGYGNPALDRIADGFYADSTQGGQRSGYLQTVRDVTNLYGSQFADIIHGSKDEDLNSLATALHTNKRPQDAELGKQYDQIKLLLRRLYNYMDSVGVQLPKTNDYFPQAWDKTAIEDDPMGFQKMLVDNAQYRTEDGKLHSFTPGTAKAATKTLLGESGRLDLKEDLAGFSPWMEASNSRTIILSDRAAAVDYMDHDLVRVMSRYITQASKRGEYTRHFGHNGEHIEAWLREAMRYGLSEAELVNDVVPAIRAMEGTLGHDISPLAKDFMSGIMAWQNLAVLPLAIFSSLIDPMGIAVRGGSVEEAWNAFKAGIKNIPESVKKNGQKLDIQDLAESIGTVESQNVLDMLGDMYGSAYMSDWARKTNNLMFRYNLMEGWNTAMRSSATVAALNFIKRHANGENEHSARYLDELGISKDVLHFDEQGNLLWKQADIARSLQAQGKDASAAKDISRQTREAITRWVDGAVLRPHAAHRPAWASDPHYMLIWHLKQFTYSFQKTILERVIHEARNGNYNPSLVLASYVPFMIAADYMRAFIQGGGEEPDWKKGKTFGETVWEGTQRAGLLGIRQFAVDGAENPAFALGPTFSYAYNATQKAADGQIGDALVQALPGNAMWKGW